MVDVKVLHTEPRPWRVEVRSVSEDFKPVEGQLVKFTTGLSVNGCGFNAGDLAVLPLETAINWRPFLTLLM
jgi:hypothetical protein